jgi:ABC-type sugar transport system substrate-binding protein/HPt (histidine-containing phosphotransfer) domain-containing protein
MNQGANIRMPHVGLVLGNPKLGTYIWTMVGSCFRNEAVARQVSQTTLPARTVTEEGSALSRLIGQGVDAIAIKPLVTDDPELLRGLDRVRAARIPVITLDSFVDHPAVVCTVGLDNWTAQALAATYIFDRLRGRGKVAFLAADPRPASGAARNASFHDLLTRYPGIQLVYQASIDWVTPVSRRTQGAEHTRAALKVAPDLDAVVASNDEAALGAIDALEERGLGDRLVSGYDGLPDGLLAVHDRRMAATIRQGPLAIARTTIDVALALARGEVIERRAAVPAELVTSDNAVELIVNALRFVPALIEDLTENHEQQRRTAIALAAAKERLEERVAERTQELDARNSKLRVVLDHVGQALFTVDLDGRISQERSAAFDQWFPGARGGTCLWTMLEPISPDAAAWASIAWEQLREGWLPQDLAIDQLPRKLHHQGRHYEIGYRPINRGGELEQLLVVISDVTEAVGLAQSEADQREQLAVFQHLMNGRDEFFEFFDECQRLVRAALSEDEDDRDGAASGPGKAAAESARATQVRALHTLKGICAIRGFGSVVSVCHALEKKLLQPGDRLDAADRAKLDEVWTALVGRVRKLTGSISSERIELARADLQAIHAAVEAGRGQTELLRLLQRLDHEPVAQRLARLAEDARALSRRLGKGDVEVTIECDDLRFDRRRWVPFWAAFVHMLRNAVDHGIESSEERAAAGKPPAGRLALRARQTTGELVIEISDDGRGVDWEGVRDKAEALGLRTETEADLLQALLNGGVSTKLAPTEISGRGAGVSACAHACEALGGQMSLESVPGKGSIFRFRFPADRGDSHLVPATSAGPAVTRSTLTS